MTHASAPAKTSVNIIPNLSYRDVEAAIDWLGHAFGFAARQVFKDEHGKVVHAELSYGNGMIMVGPVADTPFSKYMTQPDAVGGKETQCCFVIVADADSHCEQARKSGAKILLEPTTKGYGGRDYACHDLEGHLWSFGTYDPWK